MRSQSASPPPSASSVLLGGTGSPPALTLRQNNAALWRILLIQVSPKSISLTPVIQEKAPRPIGAVIATHTASLPKARTSSVRRELLTPVDDDSEVLEEAGGRSIMIFFSNTSLTSASTTPRARVHCRPAGNYPACLLAKDLGAARPSPPGPPPDAALA
ncbi:hypothetical protein C8R45DRAFT_1101533 [Mycena sanguinolenta]|nr:hypothetical protein C8R45DRAFT_1101533 [Mycena sanguinolenta]